MEKVIDHFYILLTVFFTVVGQIIMKWRLSGMPELPTNMIEKMISLLLRFLDPFIFLSFISAFLAALSWMAVLAKFEISYAYPFMALNFLFVFVIGIFF